MAATQRVVKHLRMRADSEDSARRTVLKLEDALRCATLPDADTRVLLVRRLNLGVIARSASPQTLSRLMEQRLSAAGGTWIHGTAAHAASAGFVYFRDALEARYELALRLANATPCSAWYWPLAVPEFRPAESANTNLRHIALAVAELPEASAALPAWIARLANAGVAYRLAQAVEPAMAAELLRAARLSATTRTAEEIDVVLWEASYTAGVRRATPTPKSPIAAFTALPAWLQTLARAGGYMPESENDVAASAAATRNSAHPTEPHTLRVGEARTLHDGQPNTDAAEAPAANTQKPPTVESHQPDDVVPTPHDPLAFQRAVLPVALPTTCGGLLFLLGVLQRLNYAAWADTLPENTGPRVTRRLLALMLQRLRTPAEDPAWLLTTVPNPNEQGANVETEAKARQWLTACRRWLRRVARIGAASLVMRPAVLEVTPTHVDVYFRLNDTDMRVRRTGLDLDPGWVAWYGRVVHFHYTEYQSSFAAPGTSGVIHGR